MNFTCNASIIGFIVAGRNLAYGRIEIWRKNISHTDSTVYYRSGHGVSVNVSSLNVLSGGVCLALQRKYDTFWCILHDNLQFEVQPGDIFGLELPITNDDAAEIWFTSGGPVNYIFENQLEVGSNVNLSNNTSYSNTRQLPQILFKFTSGMIFLNIAHIIDEWYTGHET